MKTSDGNIGKEQICILRLYVTGASPNSAKAITNLKNILKKYPERSYELDIIDVYQQPAIAKQENIIALPMLVKKFPLPEMRLIGDMSNSEKVKLSIGFNDDEDQWK